MLWFSVMEEPPLSKQALARIKATKSSGPRADLRRRGQLPDGRIRRWSEHSGRASARARRHPSHPARRGAIEPRDPFLLLDVTTILIDFGLRPEECFRLRWKHVQAGAVHIPFGKTENARRRIPLTQRTAAILEMPRGGGRGMGVSSPDPQRPHRETLAEEAASKACTPARSRSSSSTPSAIPASRDGRRTWTRTRWPTWPGTDAALRPPTGADRQGRHRACPQRTVRCQTHSRRGRHGTRRIAGGREWAQNWAQ